MLFRIKTPRLKDAINDIGRLITDPSIANHFKLGHRGSEEEKIKLTDQHKLVKNGNYYLENYDTRGELIDIIDLYINGDFEIAAEGIYPLFFVHNIINKYKKNEAAVITYTIESILAMVIIDRLKMILEKRGKGIARGFLIREDIKEVLKYIVVEKSFTPNNFKKIANRVVYVSLNKTIDGTLVNGGSWQYDQQDNPYSVFADGLKENVNIDDFREFVKENEIILGENSEQSQIKGTFVVFTPALDRAKQEFDNYRLAPVVNKDGHCYRSVCLNVQEDTGHLMNIYGNSQKVYARVKSLISADKAPFVGHNIDRLNVYDQPVFNRSKSYLHFDPSKINKHDELRRETTFNILVVFKEGSKELLQHLNPDAKDVGAFTQDEINSVCEYFDLQGTAGIHKQALSMSAHTADCHLAVHKDVSNQLVKIQRTLEIDCADDNLTIDFLSKLNQFREDGQAIIFDREMLKSPIGYTHKCPCCDNFMSGAMVNENQSGTDYIFTESVSSDHSVWKCKTCDHVEVNVESTQPIALTNKFKSAVQIKIVNIVESLKTSGIALQCEIDCPLNVARVISEDGLKGMCRPTSENYMGFLHGETLHPETGEMVRIEPIPVDAIVPFGAFKGKESGMALALCRFMNAIYGTEINPEYYINNGIVGHLENILNNWFEKSDLSWVRQELVPYYDDRQKEHSARLETIISSTKDGLKVGILELGVTELNEEFTKLDTKEYPMKVSPMNDLYYRTMGLDNLADLLKKHSFSSFNNQSHKDLIEHLLRVQNANPGKEYQKIEVTELSRAFEIPFTNVVPYSKWKSVLQNHDFFRNPKMQNGFYIPVTIDNRQINITFPPISTMLKLVSTNKFSARVRLNSSLRKMFEIYSVLTRDVSQVGINNLRDLINEVRKEFQGKRGLFAQTATYMYGGIKAKKISDGFIPTAVVVAEIPGFWKWTHKNGEYADIPFLEYIERLSLPSEDERSIQVYGTSQRDPFIWYLQAVNAVEIWHPHKANRYFKFKYGVSFFDVYPQFKPGGTGGILTNVLDGLFFNQDDSDGDVVRIPVPLHPEIQIALKEMNHNMHNYRMLFDEHSFPEVNSVYKLNKWWHIKYVIDEVTGNTGLNFSSPNKYRLKVTGISIEDRNDAIINATQAKESIGLITVSQWMIQEIAGYMHKTGMAPHKNAPEPISYEEMIDVCSLYQKALTQDGTIRSVKHVSGLLNRLTLDAMAVNTMTVISSKEGSEGRIISPREKMYELAEIYHSQYNAGRIMENIAEFWHNNAKVDGNKISVKKATPIAKILRAYSKLVHGGAGGFNKNEDFLQWIVHPLAENLYSYEPHKELIQLIKETDNAIFRSIFK